MPQPKKPGSPGRKPAARKPAARKPARKAAAPKTPRNGSVAKQPPRDGGSAADVPDGTGAAEAERREDQLLAAIAALRDVLSKGVVITAERLQETVDEAVTRGRMTRQDAEELVQNLVAIGRRQSQDALAEIEGLVERSAKQTRRHASARARSIGAAARRAPGTERALRTVDRVRRAAGLGQAFPITGYDGLTSAQVKERLGDLDAAQLRKVRDHERRNAKRKAVLAAIERKLR